MTSYESPGTHKSIRNGRFEFNNSRANQHNLWIISFAIFSVMRFPFSYATTRPRLQCHPLSLQKEWKLYPQRNRYSLSFRVLCVTKGTRTEDSLLQQTNGKWNRKFNHDLEVEVVRDMDATMRKIRGLWIKICELRCLSLSTSKRGANSMELSDFLQQDY